MYLIFKNLYKKLNLEYCTVLVVLCSDTITGHPYLKVFEIACKHINKMPVQLNYLVSKQTTVILCLLFLCHCRSSHIPLSSFYQIRPRQWSWQWQWGYMLRCLPALYPPHCWHGENLHPKSLIFLLCVVHKHAVCWARKPCAAHATASGGLPGLWSVSCVFLRRWHHEVPLREAGGLFRNNVSGLWPHGQRQDSTGRAHHHKEADLLTSGQGGIGRHIRSLTVLI